MKKKITVKDILLLQAVIAIYTLSTVMAAAFLGRFFWILWSGTSDPRGLCPSLAADD